MELRIQADGILNIVTSIIIIIIITVMYVVYKCIHGSYIGKHEGGIRCITCIYWELLGKKVPELVLIRKSVLAPLSYF